MTRETKIGLLVGLAFIIVIGVLLSDHLSNTSADPQARLTESGPNVRSSFTIPAGTARPPVAVVAPVASAPQNQVVTQQELGGATDAGGAISISVGGSSTVKPLTVVADAPQQPEAITPNGDPTMLVATDLTSGPTFTQMPGTHRTPRTVAAAGSPAFVDNSTRTDTTGLLVPVQDHEIQTLANAAIKAKVLKEYKAAPGDSLSKMARRFYGSDAKSNLEAILVANPHMKGDVTRVIAGRTYIIPVVEGGKGAAKAEAGKTESGKAAPEADRLAENAIALAAPATPATEIVPATRTPSISGGTPLSAILVPESTRTEKSDKPAKAEATKAESKKSGGSYTAKDGDTLWKIAASQMGSGPSWKDLKDANKDILKGSDTIRPGMVLKLPARRR